MRVALVIGHDGKNDKGAYSKELDLHEYTMNKYEVEEVNKLLDLVGIASDVVCRNSSYKELPFEINKLNPDLILSFHHNAYSDVSANGSEVLYYHKSVKGKQIANILQTRIVSTMNLTDRGVKPLRSDAVKHDRGGYLVKYTNAPCVILEPCFMSNIKELQYFLDNQLQYVNSVVGAVVDIEKLLFN